MLGDLSAHDVNKYQVVFNATDAEMQTLVSDTVGMASEAIQRKFPEAHTIFGIGNDGCCAPESH